MNLLRAVIVAGLAFTVAVLPAQAHNAGVSTSSLTIRDRTVNVEINALGRDYEKAAGSTRITLDDDVGSASRQLRADGDESG